MSDTKTRRTAEDVAADRRAKQAQELDEIRSGLVASAAEVGERLIGEKPTVRRASEIRFGDRGGMKITLQGHGAGLWHHYASGEGGDMLELVMRETGCSFPEAVAWARDFLGMPRPDFAMPLSDEERRLMERRKAEARARLEAERRAAEAALEARHEEMAQKCQREWDEAKPAPPDHPYCLSKQLRPHGLRVDRHLNLLVPMRRNGRLVNLQRIAPDGGARWREMGLGREGNKMFAAGARVKGTLLVLGDLDPDLPAAFAEGWATGESVRICTGLPVVVCWNVSNKHSVISEWRQHSPDQVLLDAADNDRHGARNAGLEMAHRLQGEFGVIPVVPMFAEGEQGTDWNDLYRLRGPREINATFIFSLGSGAGAGR